MEKEGEQGETERRSSRWGAERKETERQPQMRTPMHAHAAAPPAESDTEDDRRGKEQREKRENNAGKRSTAKMKAGRDSHWVAGVRAV